MMEKIKQKRNIIKRKVKKPTTFDFSEEGLKADILAEAKRLHIAASTAEIVADRAVANIAKWATKRVTFTTDDINRKVAQEVAKYDADLSYVYQNRGKII